MNLLDQLSKDTRLRSAPQPACRITRLVSTDFTPGGIESCLQPFPNFMTEIHESLFRLNPEAGWQTLAQLITHAGPNRLLQIAWRVTLEELFGEDLPVYGMTQKQFWRHAAVVALAAEELWNVTSVVEEDLSTALLAAWLHDVGKLFINHALKNRPDFLANYVLSERWSYPKGEEALLGASHAQIGAHLLGEWGLPETITGAIRYHHNPDLSRTTALAFLLLLADLCAHGLGESFGWGALSQASINENLDSIGVEWTQIQDAMERVKQRMKEKS